MVRIRLRRMGAKKKPFYRVIVTDQRSPRDGRFIETIGTYDPLTDPPTITMKNDRAAHWLSVGAKPSEAVERLLKKVGVIDESGQIVVPAAAETPEADAAETTEAVA